VEVVIINNGWQGMVRPNGRKSFYGERYSLLKWWRACLISPP